MFELFAVALFLYLMFRAVGLAVKLTWGAAKLAVGILMGLAFPVLILCLVFLGGIALLLPLTMIAIAAGIGKACVS